MTASKFASIESKRLGILGGGQLARMIAEAAIARGVECCILTPDPEAPATRVGISVELGDPSDGGALSRLFARCDVVTIENEFVDVSRLRGALARFPGVTLLPRLEALTIAQDKLAQKRLFRELDIPTADFEELDLASPIDSLRRAQERFPDGMVLKWSRGGYDGRGNLAVGVGARTEEILSFVARAPGGARVYAEQRIPFRRELAMVAARSRDGETLRSFPLVVTVQEGGICREVFGPATACGVNPDAEAEVRNIARRIGARLDLCGAFALELFQTAAGDLLVNEMAPRVHNSGHFSLFHDGPSQFELHVEAVTGAPLSQPTIEGWVLMRNILAPRGNVRPSTHSAQLPASTDMYWYDKRVASPGRKMGHITARASSSQQLELLRGQLRDYERTIWAEPTLREITT